MTPVENQIIDDNGGTAGLDGRFDHFVPATRGNKKWTVVECSSAVGSLLRQPLPKRQLRKIFHVDRRRKKRPPKNLYIMYEARSPRIYTLTFHKCQSHYAIVPSGTFRNNTTLPVRWVYPEKSSGTHANTCKAGPRISIN